MNRQETAWFLTTIAAPYPGVPFTDEAREVWHQSTLHTVDFDEAMLVAEALIAHEEFRPTPAVFNRELRSRRQHEAIAAPGLATLEPSSAALPTGEEPFDVKATIARLKDQLAAGGARKHWHLGPNPCEVCGGMQLPKPKPKPSVGAS